MVKSPARIALEFVNEMLIDKQLAPVADVQRLRSLRGVNGRGGEKENGKEVFHGFQNVARMWVIAEGFKNV